MSPRTSILLGTVFLCACQNLPDAYAPPEQRQPFDHFAPYKRRRVVDLSDSDANAHIVRDILGDTGAWRWTGKHPEVKVVAQTNQKMRYWIDFTVVQATFKDTGPVTISFYVNGHKLDQKTYTSEGSQHFEKPIPEDWLEPGKEALLGAEIDKLWYSPGDKQGLGFVLVRIGLTQE